MQSSDEREWEYGRESDGFTVGMLINSDPAKVGGYGPLQKRLKAGPWIPAEETK